MDVFFFWSITEEIANVLFPWKVFHSFLFTVLLKVHIQQCIEQLQSTCLCFVYFVYQQGYYERRRGIPWEAATGVVRHSCSEQRSARTSVHQGDGRWHLQAVRSLRSGDECVMSSLGGGVLAKQGSLCQWTHRLFNMQSLHVNHQVLLLACDPKSTHHTFSMSSKSMWICFYHVPLFPLPPQASSTMCGEPSPLDAGHRQLWRQRHHGCPTEQRVGCSMVGQTQVRLQYLRARQIRKRWLAMKYTCVINPTKYCYRSWIPSFIDQRKSTDKETSPQILSTPTVHHCSYPSPPLVAVDFNPKSPSLFSISPSEQYRVSVLTRSRGSSWTFRHVSLSELCPSPSSGGTGLQCARLMDTTTTSTPN